MELILLKNVEHLGERHDVVTVKNGYGRNYLIPQGLAVVATPSEKKHVEEIRRQQSAKAAKLLSDMQEVADRISSRTVEVGAKAGTSGKLFGSVTNIQVADALNREFGLEVDRRHITLLDEIKTLGSYKASLKLHKEVTAHFTFEVVQD